MYCKKFSNSLKLHESSELTFIGAVKVNLVLIQNTENSNKDRNEIQNKDDTLKDGNPEISELADLEDEFFLPGVVDLCGALHDEHQRIERAV